MIQLKRIYEKVSPDDGVRFLVDRLWPRGIRKNDVRAGTWLKEAGPSDELRKWFSHDPAKWPQFQRKYFAQIDARPDAWEPILKAAKTGTVTLLFSSRDIEHNNAVALKRYLDAKLAHGKAASRQAH